LVQSLQAQGRVRVLVLGIGSILVVLSAIGLFLWLKPGGHSPTPEPLPVFVAGPVEGFEPATVTYFELEHLYVVALAGGGMLALYDLGPGSQARLEDGDESALDCRIQFIEDENGLTDLGDPPEGFESMIFWDPCLNSGWDASGSHLIGSDGADLDRFPLSITEKSVQIDVNDRICMNPVSETAPCLPTQ
jgi:hypothetical protein